MATRTSPPEAMAPTPGAAPMPELGHLPTPELGTTRLLLAQPKPGWTFLVSPSRLFCLAGHIVPLLAKATWEPGTCGNAPRANHGEGMTAYMQARGYLPVGHADPRLANLTAFGVPFAGGPSYYLARYDGQDIERRAVRHHTDRWSRPIQIGHMLQWERDDAGWLAFLLRVRDCYMLGGLNKMQERLAIQPYLARVENVMDRGPNQPAGKRLLKQVAAHLPMAFAPESLLPYYSSGSEAIAE